MQHAWGASQYWHLKSCKLLLHRQNAELETLNADIQIEKEQLRQQNTHLTERLEAVAQAPSPTQGINADTPLDLMLNVLQKLILVSKPTTLIMLLQSIYCQATYRHIMPQRSLTRTFKIACNSCKISISCQQAAIA